MKTLVGIFVGVVVLCTSCTTHLHLFGKYEIKNDKVESKPVESQPAMTVEEIVKEYLK